MSELADEHDLGSCALGRVSSSLTFPTILAFDPRFVRGFLLSAEWRPDFSALLAANRPMSVKWGTMIQTFAKTRAKAAAEYPSGQWPATNFPYLEIQRLPGYRHRHTPSLTAGDVAGELARHLTEYAERKGCPLVYPQHDITFYLWLQACRRKLGWTVILGVLRSTSKRDHRRRIRHHFGYPKMIEQKGTAKGTTLIKLVRYVDQEGECIGCQTEFPFAELTLDHILPRKAGGECILSNVQLMCQPCNNRKDNSPACQTEC